MLYEVSVGLSGTDLNHFYVVDASDEKQAFLLAKSEFLIWVEQHTHKSVTRKAKILKRNNFGVTRRQVDCMTPDDRYAN